ncbi:MAG: 16S rRNA processing protein RimM, partial [Acetobacteraceae bacterium]|nr:16S rRNA processing protein RimM [Acetobacteraceae bacterium]
PDNRILLGVIGRPHGVRGLVRVVSYTADPAALAAYGPLSDGAGRQFTLRWRGEGLAEIAEIVGGEKVRVTDRNAAARLTNVRLYVGRDRLPAPAPDEFYLADLVGLTAVDERAVPFGRVAAVHDYGAGASLEIERGDGAVPLLLPFTQACVPQVDVAAGSLVAIPPHETEVAEGAAA